MNRVHVFLHINIPNDTQRHINRHTPCQPECTHDAFIDQFLWSSGPTRQLAAQGVNLILAWLGGAAHYLLRGFHNSMSFFVAWHRLTLVMPHVTGGGTG